MSEGQYVIKFPEFNESYTVGAISRNEAVMKAGMVLQQRHDLESLMKVAFEIEKEPEDK